MFFVVRTQLAGIVCCPDTVDGCFLDTVDRSVICYCCRLSELNLGWTELSGAALSKLAAAAPASLTKLNLTGCKDELKDARTLSGGAPDFFCPVYYIVWPGFYSRCVLFPGCGYPPLPAVHL